MKFLKRLAFYISVITTFTLLASAVWITIEAVEAGQTLQQAFLTGATEWQVLIAGLLCGVVTAVLIPGESKTRREWITRFCVHYLLINAIILGCGALFGWYTVTPVGVVYMMITVALVYVAVATMTYLRNKSTAEKINERLEQFHRGPRAKG
ncbi:MAG: DUF3021 domain-containing protein [Pygmaiobacter sp.]|nr:DUF3021 domain-containing protein [Pygmaiobacter sp.]